MQELNKTTCANYDIGATARLRDTRDNKLYWVAKLADGNCWMTQNLAYDGGGTAGDPATWGSDNSTAKYYNPGLYVYTTPTAQNQCTDTANGLSDCIKNWRNTSGWGVATDSDFYAKTSYTGIDGSTICYKAANTAANDTEFPCNVYDAHYLSGNYYSWQAATNGTGSSATTDGAQASGSICPTGWSLPLSKTTNNSTSGSFYNLLSKYGLQSSLTAGDYDIRLAPLYFVYGGNVAGRALSFAGSFGYYWSSTAYDNNNAYTLYFNTGVEPSYARGRAVGYSVRCVAR